MPTCCLQHPGAVSSSNCRSVGSLSRPVSCHSSASSAAVYRGLAVSVTRVTRHQVNLTRQDLVDLVNVSIWHTATILERIHPVFIACKRWFFSRIKIVCFMNEIDDVTLAQEVCALDYDDADVRSNLCCRYFTQTQNWLIINIRQVNSACCQ